MTRKYLTQEEVRKLMDATDNMPFPERNRCLILMAFIHGFRATELLDLRLSDIDAAGKQLNIRRIKNGFSTSHPILPEEYKLIKKWLKKRKTLVHGIDGDWLFLSRKRRPLSRQHFFTIIREAGRLAGLPVSTHPHMLRHACGYALADNGVDTRLLQDYLGHKNIQHTVRYTASNAARFSGIWRPRICR
ncbi:tyrosine-type DNA invertase [Escherichia coli]|nr:tyrosine-type recombinase/integrase [Escherichia coli]HAW0201218.1 tyrosine-type recombinase/integrase [Escherichia coli]HAW0238146.1 tyrosine-type recombinase/integrase [Escherichia coli]HAX2910724.1 tyrosine-type recombinase/integrase [Escherichia coli]HBB2306415.1 tyrosine-type recombinase/integrase [Escherichia coli]